MATEFTTATESFEFATTRLGVPRNEADGANQLKERSGTTLGDGVVITDSRFLTADNGGATAPADLTVQRGFGLTNGEGPSGAATSISSTTPTDGAASEIALVRTSDTTAGPLMGMMFFADPNEASGAMVATGYSRFDDGATPKSVAVTLDADSIMSVTLKNRIGANDVWVTTNVEEGVEGGWQGSGVFQSLDVDGDGTGTHYLAGVMVGPLRDAEGNIVYAIDPISDVYRDLAAQLQAGGVAADDIGRNALVASSAGGRLDGTYLNEDMLGGAGVDDLRGMNGNDVLTGAGGADNLRGGNGEDTLLGGADDDVLRGQGDDDLVMGGAGNDTICGNNGNDVLVDDGGDDRLVGGNGDDSLNSGDGNNTLVGGAGDDTMTGGNDADTLNGGNNDDVLIGGGGDDRLIGGNGDDSMDGGSGSNRLNAGAGDDTLIGGNAADTLNGNDDNDMLFGGGGNDRLDGGAGADVLTGGAGADRFFFSSDGGDEVLDFDLSEDRLHVRSTGANSIADLILTDLAPGRVQVTVGGQSVILNDGDGVVDFVAADFVANDFIF